MNKFFKNLEEGYGKALSRQILFFTFGWCIGNVIKLIIESFIGSKNK